MIIERSTLPVGEFGSQELMKYKERLCIALKAAKICVFEVDLLHQRYTFFENAEDIFHVSGERILADVAPYSKLAPLDYQQAVSEYFSHPQDQDTIDRAFQCIFQGQSTTYQARMRAGGSNYIWCKLDVSPIMQDGIPVRMIGVITDISEIKARTDLLEMQSTQDSFTGVYNKEHAQTLIKSIFANGIQVQHALILVDIDNFKRINDTFGHATGDKILKLFANNLKKTFRKTDIVSRFGGDEFLILVQNVEDRTILHKKLSKLLKATPRYGCTSSIGVSIFPQQGTTLEHLFAKADKALYMSKQTKNTYTIFKDEYKLD